MGGLRSRGPVTLALLCALLVVACGESRAGRGAGLGPRAAAEADDPVAFGRIEPFALTSQTGATITLEELRGRPWVVACIFTTCTGPCPSITRAMGRIQRRLAGVDARLVSITVDPQRDSPAVLARYAEAFDADPERWFFLTGADEAEVHRLIRSSFKMPVDRLDEPDPRTGDLLTHDRRLAVIDAQGVIRGWYDSQTPEQVDLLVRRVRFLASQGR